MEPMFFVMAIMGCGDGALQCADARTLPTHYATAAECRAALPRGLAENTDLDYPTVMADCRANGPRVAKATTPKPKG